jgi:hypothetical protein
MKNLALATIVALAVAAPALLAQTHEKKIKEAEVPKAVIETVTNKYPKAKTIRFEQDTLDGKSIFEVGLENAGEKLDVSLSPEGRILEEEKRIKASDLPAEIKKGLAASKYAKWTVKSAERVVREEKDDAPIYEILVADKGATTELILDKAGTITKEEPKRKSDSD